MHNLIEAIKEKQKAKHLTDGALASLLGIDRSTWAKIKSGRRKPGIKFLRAVNDKLMRVELFDNSISSPSHKPLSQKLGGFLGKVRYFITRPFY